MAILNPPPIGEPVTMDGKPMSPIWIRWLTLLQGQFTGNIPGGPASELGELSDVVTNYNAPVAADGNNMFLGDGSGGLTPTGERLVALGQNTMSALTNVAGNTADNAVAVGFEALKNLTIGSDLVAVGSLALTANTTGFQSTAVGSLAGSNITTGARGIFIGYNALAPTPTTNDYLNIGGAITGSLVTGPALMNGFTTTTQSALDNSTKVATTAYVDGAVAASIVATSADFTQSFMLMGA